MDGSQTTKTIRVILAQPRGFCAGVERAIDIVERALTKFGPPIYVRHEIVHNRHVVEDLRARGAVFVDELDEVPEGAWTVFSAHGVARKVVQAAADRSLPVIDATCPLVAKVHAEGRRYASQGRELVLIGHAGHAEVEGTIGQIPGKVHLVQTVADVVALTPGTPEKLAYVTQTTLSVDDTRTVIDVAVFNVGARSILFRASGQSILKGSSTWFNRDESLRLNADQGIRLAMTDLSLNLEKEAASFKPLFELPTIQNKKF